ncbi:phage head spike fiber domain-containing protein [Methylobacterium isbiliense]|uniref:Uncharacterized protein n=1 Tax=Methylobacterium isbiliense TaxID=315478 RepID=A0ABQ4SBE2_9HYPH|nr:hypothetical protein [Methylobacterium isbiliense]MDN3622616.1 hypothetical protein [Methylobacterium isbiliense]GJE00536.1 hypothetical protein GMJLKIPL_2459 [Methylobacterium isbiliense]
MVALGRLGALTPASASLDLNFVTGQALVGKSKSAVEAALAFDRESAAWNYDIGGLLRQATADEMRLAYDPHSGLPLGLLIEPGSTDMWSRTETFTDGVWGKSGVSLFSTSVSGLSGINSGTRVVDNGATPGSISRTVGIATGAAAYTASFVARAVLGGARYIEINVYLAGGSGDQGGSVVFDLVLGRVVSASGVYYGMLPAPGNSWRCIIGAYNTNGNSGLAVGLRRWPSDPTTGYDLLAASLEARDAATSLIRSDATGLTRAAETASLPMGDWFNPLEGSFFAEIITNASPFADQQILAVRNNGGGVMGLSRSQFGPAIAVSAPGLGMTMYGAPQFGSVRAGFSYSGAGWVGVKLGGGNDYIYGSALTASGAVPSGLTTLDLGHYNGGSQLNGILRRVVYFPRALSATELSNVIS